LLSKNKDAGPQEPAVTDEYTCYNEKQLKAVGITQILKQRLILLYRKLTDREKLKLISISIVKIFNRKAEGASLTTSKK